MKSMPELACWHGGPFCHALKLENPTLCVKTSAPDYAWPFVMKAVFPFEDSAERLGEWQRRFGRARIGSAQSLLV